jgi:NAD kinase
MSGCIVSKRGTFGTVKRWYTTEAGVPCVVIEWGPLGWLTPVEEADCKRLRSRFESEARAEAEEWIASLDANDS